MVQVRVAGVGMDESGQHVVLLKPIDSAPGDGTVLPIWIGALEATAIMIAIEGTAVPRPLTHDLMKSLLDTTGADVLRVDVTRLDDGTYYADITVRTLGGTRVVDARPSDAVALASRVGADIWVADAVLAEAGVPDMTADDADAPDDDDVRGDADEVSVDEFKRFLNDVDPDDFRG